MQKVITSTPKGLSTNEPIHNDDGVNWGNRSHRLAVYLHKPTTDSITLKIWGMIKDKDNDFHWMYIETLNVGAGYTDMALPVRNDVLAYDRLYVHVSSGSVPMGATYSFMSEPNVVYPR